MGPLNRKLEGGQVGQEHSDGVGVKTGRRR